jgi:hypothetical protein
MTDEQDPGARQLKLRAEVAARLAEMSEDELRAWEAKNRKRRAARRHSVEPVGRRPKDRKNRPLEVLLEEVEAGRLRLADMEPREQKVWLQYLSGLKQPKPKEQVKSQEELEEDEDNLENEMALNRIKAWYGHDPKRLKREIQDFWKRRQHHRRLMKAAKLFLIQRDRREYEQKLRALFYMGDAHNASTAHAALGPAQSYSWVASRWRLWTAEKDAAAAQAKETDAAHEAAMEAADPGRHERERDQFLANLIDADELDETE